MMDILTKERKNWRNMNEKIEEIRVTRIERFYERVGDQILSDFVPLDGELFRSKEPVIFQDRLNGEYTPIREGDSWGETWDSAWFHLKVQVPTSWKGKKVAAWLDFSGEGLVYSGDGEMLQGISNGSVFREEFSRDVVRLIDSCAGGEEIELWVEAAANGLFGVITEPDPALDSPKRYGYYDAKVVAMRLCVFDEEIWELHLDLRTLIGLIKHLPKDSVRRACIIDTVNSAIDAFTDHRDNAGKCRARLKQELDKPTCESDLAATAVGHAHIDTAWLWTVQETIRKCARTFSSQIALMDQYPEYVFGASQPQLYAFVKEHYPALYGKIKQRVAEGRWELQGGMWVEADCNLISGESMVRQILHGKNFFMDEFGIDVDNLWLPDVFGYSGSMPQIMKKSGIDYFITQKLSWNQINEFPHHTFIWRGIDSSEVLTHFPPEDTYNSYLSTDFLVPAQDKFKEKGFLPEFISLFGTGNGGGGPKEENIELGKRMEDLEGAPRVRFGTARDFFHRLDTHRDNISTWAGELYLEAHRGTLTTHGLVKKQNRLLEQQLKVTEFLWSCLPLEFYPSEELDRIWKTVLINQFHDILPGSSITKVYQVTHTEYRQALDSLDDLMQRAAEKLFNPSHDALVAFNSTHYPYHGPVVLPEGWQQCGVEDQHGNTLPAQWEGEQVIVQINIPPYSFVTIKKASGDVPVPVDTSSLVLENDLVRYQFDNDGRLLQAWDKEVKRNIIPEGKMGNVLTLYEDHPNDFDAWEIEIFYEDAVIDTATASGMDFLPRGPVRQGFRFRLGVGKSDIEQKVTLANHSKKLDFDTTVEWREKHKMLRVAFPVEVYTDQATFDIQYGYIQRATHRNTSWDAAKFEVAAHKYADISEQDYGVALLNDCKYGHKVLGNVLDLNLLRAPTNPDPDADQGIHQFTYSFLPHNGELIHSNVIAQAAHLNGGITTFNGYDAGEFVVPWKLEGDGLSLEVMKKAEKEDCLILRIVETKGRLSTGQLIVGNPDAFLVDTNLMEWEDGDKLSCANPIELMLNPFEIKTFKLV